MDVNSLSLLQNKSSTQKKDLQMNLVVAQNAVRLENSRTEAAAVSVVNAKCSLLYVLLAVKKPQFLSNLLVTNRYTAVTVTNPAPETTGKFLQSRTLPENQGGFFLPAIEIFGFDYIYK